MSTSDTQLKFNIVDFSTDENRESITDLQPKNGRANKLNPEDRPFHDWYRFVLSYPPHLVRTYIEKFNLDQGQVILDPFCGTGTTLIESKLAGIKAIGIEANPFPYFASKVKVDWDIDPDLLLSTSRLIADQAYEILKNQGIDDNFSFELIGRNVKLKTLDPEAESLLLTNSISPLPLHKSLVLIDCLNQYQNSPGYSYMLLALANALVYKISNLHFGPEVGVKNPKPDVPVIANWLLEIEKISSDLRKFSGEKYPSADVFLSDAREFNHIIPNSVDAVITSPPYPNEKDYTRTTRLESVLLGFINNKAELRALKKQLVRSNTRGVYKGDNDDQWISDHAVIQQIADNIEKRRIELGKDSGFERQYAKVTKLYFGGMARHLSELRKVLKPGAQLAYVVGDQASYLRVMIRTGQLLADIAHNLGYEVMGIDLFRTRLATATKEYLREEVLLLRWHG